MSRLILPLKNEAGDVIGEITAVYPEVAAPLEVSFVGYTRDPATIAMLRSGPMKLSLDEDVL